MLLRSLVVLCVFSFLSISSGESNKVFEPKEGSHHRVLFVSVSDVTTAYALSIFSSCYQHLLDTHSENIVMIMDSFGPSHLGKLYSVEVGNAQSDLLESHHGDSVDLSIIWDPYCKYHKIETLLPSSPKLLISLYKTDYVCNISNLTDNIYTRLVRFNAVNSVELIKSLLPSVKKIVVISGMSSADESTVKDIKQQVGFSYEDIVIDYQQYKTIEESVDAVADLPSDCAVLFALMTQDADGNSYSFENISKQLAAASSVPVFGMLDDYLGSGIVGGFLDSPKVLGKYAGELVNQILSKDMGSIEQHAVFSDRGQYMFDWRQLRKWNISMSDLPENAIVLYKTEGVLELHPWIFPAVASMILLLIVIVFYYRHKKRTVEQLLQKEIREKELESRLRLMFENMPFGFCIFGIVYDDIGEPVDYRVLQINPHWLEITDDYYVDSIGKTLQTIIPDLDKSWYDFLYSVAHTHRTNELQVYADLINKHLYAKAFYVEGDKIAVILSDVSQISDIKHKLEESENFLRTVIDTLPIRISWKDLNSVYLGANMAWARDTGYKSPEKLIGKTDFDMGWAREDVENLIKDDKEICSSGIPKLNNEIVLRKQNGTIHWVRMNKLALKDSSKKCVGVLTTYEDTTEYRKLERQLKRTQFVVDTQIDQVYWFDENGYIAYVNDSGAAAIGYDKKQLIGMHCKDIFEGLLPDESWEKFWSNIVSIGQWAIECLNICRSGYKLAVEVQANYFEFQGEKRVCCIARDIIERKHMQDALEERVAELQRLSTAIEQSSDIIVITDAEGQVEYVNPAFEKTTGYTVNEVITQNMHMLSSGNTKPEVYDELWSTIKSGKTWVGNIENKKKDGTLYIEHTTISAVSDALGNITNYVAIKKDITDDIERENKLQKAQKMEAVGQLAGGIAHDFNNTMQAVLGFTELLMMGHGADDPEMMDLLEIKKATLHASSLTRQLLDFSRKTPSRKVVLSINDIVIAAKQILNSVIGDNIMLDIDLADDLKTIWGDSEQIQRVLVNMALNAKDAMPHGGMLRITTANVTYQDDDSEKVSNLVEKEFVCLAVEDNGIGMSEDVQKHLFEPFFSTKELGKGTGLGLASAYGIISKHRGRITVTSKLGEGTTFHIYFPSSANTFTAEV